MTKTKLKTIAELKLPNLAAYNKLILIQEETVCFQIIEDKTKANNYGDARLSWTKISGNFEPTPGPPKPDYKRKFFKYKIDDVTSNPEEWITELELLRGDL